MVTSEEVALDRNPREEFEVSGNERTEVATDVWVVCDPEDPDFGKVMDLDGRSSVFGDYGLADRSNGFFSVVKRRTPDHLPVFAI